MVRPEIFQLRHYITLALAIGATKVITEPRLPGAQNSVIEVALELLPDGILMRMINLGIGNIGNLPSAQEQAGSSHRVFSENHVRGKASDGVERVLSICGKTIRNEDALQAELPTAFQRPDTRGLRVIKNPAVRLNRIGFLTGQLPSVGRTYEWVVKGGKQ